MRDLFTYIKEGFYKNIGTPEFIENCHEIIDHFRSCEYDCRFFEQAGEYDIAVDSEMMTIKFTSKKGRPSVFFNLCDKENAKQISEIGIQEITFAELYKKGRREFLEITYISSLDNDFNYLNLSSQR